MEHEAMFFPWNAPAAQKSFKGVRIADDTLRDGLQGPYVTNPSLDEKKEILSRMCRCNVDIGILSYPSSSGKAYEEAAAMLAHIAANGLSLIPALTGRTAAQDIEPIVALQRLTALRVMVYAFIGCSPIRQLVEGWDIGFITGQIEDTLALLAKNRMDAVIVIEDCTRSRPEDLRAVFACIKKNGGRGVCIADTVGYCDPSGVSSIMRFAKAELGEDIAIEWHGHNDRGFALANALKAIEEGASAVHATAMGIGERTGNLSLEQLLANLHLYGREDIDLGHMNAYAEAVARYTRIPIHGSQPVIGQNIFTTGTGVHAAAIYKAYAMGAPGLADAVYSAVPASRLGRSQQIEVSHMSGKYNAMAKLASMGVACDEAAVSAVMDLAKRSRAFLTEDDIRGALAARGGAHA